VTREQLLAQARAWLSDDPDSETRFALETLIASDDLPALEELFFGPLEFGTAGLRAVVGPGLARMNRVVVARATWAVGKQLLATFPDARERGVIIGYDGRTHSRAFAETACEVLAGLGLRVQLTTRPTPTPLVAFASTHLLATAAIVITASHNPPAYNGYKVFWRNGAQIVPPIDKSIAALFEAAPAYSAIPRLDLDDARKRGLLGDVPEAVDRAYLDGALQVTATTRAIDRSLRIAYTALHGVGKPWVERALHMAGFENLFIVAEQAEPDGAFPTVKFPNPEEPGAMDLLLATAREHDADIALANDPDADRLAVAARNAQGEYVQFSGNEVGVLLGHDAIVRAGAAVKRPLVVNTIVSSPLLRVIAEKMGVRAEQTLTGFKWIANRALELDRTEGTSFLFGYEEALGYSMGTLVRDKDGITAALAVAALAASLKHDGRTLITALESIYREFGLFESGQMNLVREGIAGKAELESVMARLRQAPPTSLGGVTVKALVDYARGLRKVGESETPTLLPPSNVVALELDGGHRVIVRPSGTEPKVKCYFDVYESVRAGDALSAARERARATLSMLRTALGETLGVPER
jgi:phosphomannomutase